MKGSLFSRLMMIEKKIENVRKRMKTRNYVRSILNEISFSFHQ